MESNAFENAGVLMTGNLWSIPTDWTKIEELEQSEEIVEYLFEQYVDLLKPVIKNRSRTLGLEIEEILSDIFYKLIRPGNPNETLREKPLSTRLKRGKYLFSISQEEQEQLKSILNQDKCPSEFQTILEASLVSKSEKKETRWTIQTKEKDTFWQLTNNINGTIYFIVAEEEEFKFYRKNRLRGILSSLINQSIGSLNRKNRAYDTFKNNLKEQSIEQDPNTPIKAKMEDETFSELLANLKILEVEKPEYYQAIYSYYFGGKKHREIAEEFKITEDNAKARLSRGKKWLAKHLQICMDDQTGQILVSTVA